MLVSIISILILIIFVFNPIFRKIILKVDKQPRDAPPREDPAYERDTSYGRRILDIKTVNLGIPDNETIRTNGEKESWTLQSGQIGLDFRKEKREEKSVLKQMETLNTLKQALIWKEILSPPLALRDSDHLY